MKRIIPLIALASAACQTPEPTSSERSTENALLPAATTPFAGQPQQPDTLAAKQTMKQTTPNKAELDESADLSVQKFGECNAAPQLKQWASRARNVADANGDGVVSKAEANGALNFLVGGLFFRADENADGKLSAQERKQAKQDLVAQHPELGDALSSLASNEQFSALLSAVDDRIPETVELAQVRQGASKAVDHVFSTADRNSDGKISQLEADEGFNLAFAAAGRFAFNKADANDDKRLTKDEFTSALHAPLMRAFGAADANKDGSLTEVEAASMMAWMSERVDAVGERGYEALSGVMNTDGRGN